MNGDDQVLLIFMLLFGVIGLGIVVIAGVLVALYRLMKSEP